MALPNASASVIGMITENPDSALGSVPPRMVHFEPILPRKSWRKSIFRILPRFSSNLVISGARSGKAALSIVIDWS